MFRMELPFAINRCAIIEKKNLRFEETKQSRLNLLI